MEPQELIKFVQSFGLIIDDITMRYNSDGELIDFSVYMAEDDDEEFEIDTYLSRGGDMRGLNNN